MTSKLYVIGTGPGSTEHLTQKALQAIEESEVIVGYLTYTNLIKELVLGKEIISSGMRKEVDRCQEAVEIAKSGKIVAMISSGDSGVYGMAGIILEIQQKIAPDLEVEIVPGITSAISSASLIGAPLMNDFAVISLSDLMTSWTVIEKRVEAAAMGDFVMSIYNPKSKERVNQIEIARNIILKYRSPETPVGIIKNAMREKSATTLTTLEKMLEFDIDMTTTLIVGNSQTYVQDNKMITPRGYKVNDNK